MNDCVPEAMCSNTEGSFACICPPSAARDDTLNGREGEGCVGEICVLNILACCYMITKVYKVLYII